MKKIAIVLFLLISFLLVSCKNETNEDNKYLDIINKTEDFVVIDDNVHETIIGKEQMDEFYERTKQGEKLKLKFIRIYENEEEPYEFFIAYDGTSYITDYKILTNSPEISSYKYLIYSEEQLLGSNENVEKCECYCLANDETHTYQKVLRANLSSQFEDLIFDAIPFYSNIIMKEENE